MRNFKKILKTVGIFLLAVAVLSAFFIECYLRGENFHYQDGLEREELSGKVELLVCGASYVLFGVRPDVLDRELGLKSYNLSGTMMTMEGRYALLEKELSRNPIRTVLLEVSPDTLLRDRAEEGPHGDLPMLGRLSDGADRWSYFRLAFPITEWPEVYYDMVSKGIESALKLVTGSYQTRNQIMVDGFYDHHKENREVPSNYWEIYHIQSLSEDLRSENVTGLSRIVELCQSHGAQVVLISTPKSKYFNLIMRNLDFYQDWFENFAALHGVRYFNFNLHREKPVLLPDQQYFYDETHLNSEGGQIFTRMLAETLAAEWAGEDTEAAFYDSYADLIRSTTKFGQ